MAEFKSISQNPGTQLSHLEMVNDNALKWQFRVANFDDDVPAGRKLNEDLHKLALAHGQDYLLMEATFPADYPEKPFFLRVLSPRCRMYTGHVTAGGSICIEALTLSGSPGSWQAAYCFESVIQLVLTNMIHCESVMVRTATGPGGRSGPLRVDLHMGNRVMQPYSEWEAQAAFERMMNHHRTNGWGLRGDGFRLHDQFESFRQRIDGARSLEPGEASGGLASWTSADALPWASQLAHSMLAQPSSASPAGAPEQRSTGCWRDVPVDPASLSRVRWEPSSPRVTRHDAFDEAPAWPSAESSDAASLLAKQVTLSQESDKAIPSPPWLKGIHQSQDLQDNQAFPDLVPIARPSGPQARLSVTLPKFAQSFGCTASQPEGLGDLYGRQDARQTNAAVPQAGFQPDTAKAVGGGHLQREEQEADSVPRRHSSICGGLGLMSWAKGSGKAKPSRQLESSVADGLSPQLLSAAEAEASDLSREAQLVTGKTKAPMRTKPHSGMGATFKSAFEPRKRRSSAPLSRIAPGTAGVISLDSEEEEDDFMTFLRGMDLPAATRRKRDAPSGLSDLISTADAVQTDGMATLTDARHLRHTARTPSHVDRPAGKDEDQALDRVTGDLIPDKCEDVEVFSLPKRKRQRHPIIEGLSEDDPFPECAESTLQDEVDNMSASDAARMFREEATQRRDGKKSRSSRGKRIKRAHETEAELVASQDALEQKAEAIDLTMDLAQVDFASQLEQMDVELQAPAAAAAAPAMEAEMQKMQAMKEKLQQEIE
ncbi:hypothetical protein WJX84_000696, partial [Apatococcus fuscideae]